jgi:acetoin utilization protein AcuC
MRAYVEIARTLRGFNLPWLALGGGGYDPLATTRAWTLMFGEMIGRAFEDELPPEFSARRGGEYLRDHDAPHIPPEVKTRAREYANARLKQLHELIPLLRRAADSPQ